MSATPKVGDVMRFSRFSMVGNGRWMCSKRQPMWGLSVFSENDHDWGDFVWLLGGNDNHSGPNQQGDVISYDGDDEWTIVPPENWPDEVCRLVALRALLGETDDTG